MQHRTTRTGRFHFAAWIAALVALMMCSVVAAPVASAGASVWPTVTFLNHATVRANGAGAIVQISVACTGLKISYLEVGVYTSRPDGTIAGAGGYATLTRVCTAEPQVISAPLEADNLGLENSSVPGDAGPLPAGHATTVAYAPCVGYNCLSRDYPGQSVTLVNSADLDRLSDVVTTVGPHPALRANGAAADVNFTSRCAQTITVRAGNTEIHQSNSTPLVQNATSKIDSAISCTSPTVGYHTRVYPSTFTSTAPLHTGAAFVISYGSNVSGSLFGQVDIR